jgi:serine/threonine-protein kinase RsbT
LVRRSHRAPPKSPWTYEVRAAVDLYRPRSAIRELCAALGFPRADGQELAIVVSELTSNILKYGVRGSVQFERIDSAKHGIGVMIVARDIGPPFRDLDMALRDGHDDRGPIDPGTLLKRGGLGTGLGAVLRLTDSFDVGSTSDGKKISVIRYRTRPRCTARR